MISKEEIKKGNRRALSKAITLIESHLPEHRRQALELLKSIYSETGHAKVIGITGVPGAGKSTFIEYLGSELVNQNKKVAVLAVDPSSPVSGGSILGDKTRMEDLSNHENAFIRPTPAKGHLGGVSQYTLETILLCDYAGFDYVLVESVGVGQSEIELSEMVDHMVFIALPNAGDEIQGIKMGILEVIDSIVINKADGKFVDAAAKTKVQLQSALHYFNRKIDGQNIFQVSSLKKKGLEQVIESWGKFFKDYKKKDLGKTFAKRIIKNEVMGWLSSQNSYQELAQKDVDNPFEVAHKILNKIKLD